MDCRFALTCGQSVQVDAAKAFQIERYGAPHPGKVEDHVAVEEPMEIRVDGHPISVVMRTPGHDGDLALGFLLTERVISQRSEVRKMDERPEENRVLVFLHDGVEVDLNRLSRHLFAASSCGICGKTRLESIFLDSPPLTHRLEIPDHVLLAAPDQLRAAQPGFDSTGGVHAAGLFSPQGELLIAREDIGRHNAVDKVIGRALADDIPLKDGFLLVSGRVSFEIMQKAQVAGIQLVAAVSAPSSLAIEFAKGSGQSLIAFLRPPGFNRYTD
ncbi:formate dehydrogenase accessory sulfurtransferase FdhD [Luteolibacter pohnpeiensis]|uniref:Sulfur carrier protein FdhD n=1 Tax=Luteolibacter pohnpeiensis TaxID=454153 RepID=A0A934VXB6_9BACT|nr:formate dehydrogenase accessory sulfurtransferase FdhD [Luteolibacter pohnpeiensis]MBK1883369.1 formate dehydrogenase accessory sulfurtransferase FdhD [Luteolibacter pohnpeiensis]